MLLRVGTRRSPLAMAQTNFVIGLIKAAFPEIEFEIRSASTVADRDRVSEFHQFRMVGVFTTEHEEQLLRNEVDFVVHSLKDLPTTLRDGLVLAAVPKREDPRDALCGATLESLRPGARVGTGSLRRRAQILSLRPDVTVVPIRGNVGPRLAKIEGDDALDAVILAEAGLRRLGLADATTETLDPHAFPYAVGQGALGIEARAQDSDILKVLQAIQCPQTRAEVDAERAMMHTLGAGCSLPVGACASWKDGRLTLQAQVTSLDGQERIIATEEGPAETAADLGVATGEALKTQGGTRILETSYREFNSHFKLFKS
ncbi:hydroxymethylbilane synthase [Bosea vestrisii]|jgi:hydroxymethylbilane synthase|uniref:hydroxymethylbilane synthase n=1 Tax=Bosea sp. OAE752 TaxID=2663873 RepID=UPI0011536E1D